MTYHNSGRVYNFPKVFNGFKVRGLDDSKMLSMNTYCSQLCCIHGAFTIVFKLENTYLLSKQILQTWLHIVQQESQVLVHFQRARNFKHLLQTWVPNTIMFPLPCTMHAFDIKTMLGC